MTKLSGVREQSGKIIIDFYYLTIRCREILPLEPTPKNLKYAAQLRAAILFEISQGKFEYEKYFPKSKKCKRFTAKKDITVGDLLNEQLNIYQRRYESGTLELSTLMPYKRAITNYLIPRFGHILITALTPADLRSWVMSLSIKAKTYRNIIIPLTATLSDAVINGYIEDNPLDIADLGKLIKQLAPPKIDGINPFGIDEVNSIISTASGQFKNMLEFAFFSGLRIGELIALRWSDVDLINGVINVSRNIVLNNEKAPKTASGVRKVSILPRAKKALLAQQQYTTQFDDFVFHDPNSNQRWHRDNNIRKLWKQVLSEANVVYRYPYQMRHTYASMLLTGGENIAWIAKQMGHINTEMVIKNYAKFIPDDNLKGGYKLKGNY